MSSQELPPRESIETILRRRVGPSRPYKQIPSEVEGITLLAVDEKEIEPSLTVKETRRFAFLADRLARRRRQINRYTKLENQVSASIKQMVSNFPGLRGLESRKHNLRLPIHPQHKLTWNQEKLQQTLGPAYPDYVDEKLEFTVPILPGRITPEGPLTQELIKSAVFRGLGTLGLSEAELSMTVATKLKLDVHIDNMVEMIDQGGIQLPPDVATVETTWIIDEPKPLKNLVSR